QGREGDDDRLAPFPGPDVPLVDPLGDDGVPQQPDPAGVPVSRKQKCQRGHIGCNDNRRIRKESRHIRPPERIPGTTLVEFYFFRNWSRDTTLGPSSPAGAGVSAAASASVPGASSGTAGVSNCSRNCTDGS